MKLNINWRELIKKFNPLYQISNPVIFIVEILSIFISIMFVQKLIFERTDLIFYGIITLLFWLTLFFSNLADSIAESRSYAQARMLRSQKENLMAKKLNEPNINSLHKIILAETLCQNDYILVEKNDIIPGDGEVIAGLAAIDESAITGESTPVIREPGGDKGTVICGTTVLSDWLIVKITVDPGKTFLDRMIYLIESSHRNKAPNEIALNFFLTILTFILIVVVVTFYFFANYIANVEHTNHVVSMVVLVSLLICLLPTTIGALLSAIGISGINRLMKINIIALSGQAVEAAGSIDYMLLDKTGTITLGNRQAVGIVLAENTTLFELCEALYLSSLSDDTPEGRSIINYLRNLNNTLNKISLPEYTEWIPFSAHTRMSGVNIGTRMIRKGSVDGITRFAKELGVKITEGLLKNVEQIARRGETPLLVFEGEKILGIVRLKDIVKAGLKEKFRELRLQYIKTLMITGDNSLTAATIAAEAGVDDFLAEATPTLKLNMIRKLQSEGNIVGMAGDGTNDAPALAQADIALAMFNGTQAAKEAANMVDLDSNPTKMIEVVKIGKELLITRGALTTFSIANDVAKYFAIIPAACTPLFPALNTLNVMNLSTPKNAILAAVIFNTIIILVLLPLALKGVTLKNNLSVNYLLGRNLLIYGLGGVITPFLGIKLIDILITWMQIF